jgi:hypothetical protein
LKQQIFLKKNSTLWGNNSYLQQHIGTENEREKKFIFLKEGATDITVQTVRKMVRQVSQTSIQDLGLIAEMRHIQRDNIHVIEVEKCGW